MGVMLRAVVVGINEYRDERYRHRARLRFASSDAQKIASLLRSSSQVFTAENVTLLVNEEATRKTVRDSLNNTFSRRSSDNNTIALFYFAGHGIVNQYDKHISLCCHDVDFTDPETGGIRLNDIYNWIASTTAECVIVILDACFSGGIVVGPVGHLSSAQQALQAIEALRYPEGKTVAIFAACGSDEAARERKGLAHGIFTYELLRGWRDGQAQEKKDGIVYLTGLVHFLLQDMNKYTQTPRVTISGGSRPIALWQVEQSVLKTSPPLAPPPVAPSVLPVQTSSSTGMIYSQFILPTSTRPQSSNRQERNKLITLAILIVLSALIILGLIGFFIVHLFIH